MSHQITGSENRQVICLEKQPVTSGRGEAQPEAKSLMGPSEQIFKQAHIWAYESKCCSVRSASPYIRWDWDISLV